MNSKILQAKNQQGLSLIEIMVAMVISIFLLGGVIQVYTSNKASYGFSEAMSRIQENGRFAMDSITQDLRMAGFMGCATFDPTDPANVVNNLNTEEGDQYDFLNSPAIEGLDENEGTNGSDSFALFGPVPSQTNIVTPYGPGASATVKVTPTSAIAAGDIVLLTNCKGADIFQISSLTSSLEANSLAVVHNTGDSTTPGNYNPTNCAGGNAHCLSQVYGGDAALLKLQKVTYTIEAGESGEPALIRTVFNERQELVDGIEQMQVLYGLNTDPATTDTTPNQYLSSNLITTDDEWNSVTAVRVMLLVRSDSNVSLGSAQTYSYNGVNITASDNKLRQVFSATIALRNRI